MFPIPVYHIPKSALRTNWELKHEDLLVDCKCAGIRIPSLICSFRLIPGKHRHGLARNKTNQVEPPVQPPSSRRSTTFSITFCRHDYSSSPCARPRFPPTFLHPSLCPPPATTDLSIHPLMNPLPLHSLSPPVLPKPQVSYKTTSPGVIEANCTSVSRPPAEIVWNVERDNRTVGPPVTTLLPQDDGTTLVISTLTVRSGLLKDVSVKCLVHHKGLESPIAVSMNTKSESGVRCGAHPSILPTDVGLLHVVYSSHPRIVTFPVNFMCFPCVAQLERPSPS